jgi:hypothetical protein
MDVFVTKLDREGEILWSTLLGGSAYDRAYAVRLDAEGRVFVAGRAGPGFPTTPGVVQERFAGDAEPNEAYGPQDGFVTVLSADGSRVVWSTYFGGPGRGLVRDMDVDATGNVHVTLIEVDRDMAHVGEGALFGSRSGRWAGVVAQLSPDGARVRWATYLGGREGATPTSVRAGADGSTHVAGFTRSPDFPTSEGAFDDSFNGVEDAFALRIAADGRELLGSTFLGGEGADGAAGAQALAVAGDGTMVVCGYTGSFDFPVTEGAFQRVHRGGFSGTWEEKGDRWVARVSADARELLASTLYGGSARDGGEGLCLDAAGNVVLASFTYSEDAPTTADDRPQQARGRGDALALVLSGDLSQLLLARRLGGGARDHFRACAAGDGRLWFAGMTESRDWPVVGSRRRPPGRQDCTLVLFDN